MGVVRVATPLCPAGHLPHKGGDWLAAPASLHLNRLHLARPSRDSISPLVGEMPDRAEGGIAAANSKDRKTEYTLTSPDSSR